jgi:tetratricopeptide (TPR) repeat protein
MKNMAYKLVIFLIILCVSLSGRQRPDPNPKLLYKPGRLWHTCTVLYSTEQYLPALFHMAVYKSGSPRAQECDTASLHMIRIFKLLGLYDPAQWECEEALRNYIYSPIREEFFIEWYKISDMSPFYSKEPGFKPDTIWPGEINARNYILGKALFHADKYDKALKKLDLVREKGGQYASARGLAAVIRAKQNKPEQAIKSLQAAVTGDYFNNALIMTALCALTGSHKMPVEMDINQTLISLNSEKHRNLELLAWAHVTRALEFLKQGNRDSSKSHFDLCFKFADSCLSLAWERPGKIKDLKKELRTKRDSLSKSARKVYRDLYEKAYRLVKKDKPGIFEKIEIEKTGEFMEWRKQAQILVRLADNVNRLQEQLDFHENLNRKAMQRISDIALKKPEEVIKQGIEKTARSLLAE